MNDSLLQFDLVRTSVIAGSPTLKEQISALQKTYTAVCTAPFDMDGAAPVLGRIAGRLAQPGIDFCFFGTYFLPGSIRNDFDLGPVLFFRTELLKKLATQMDNNYRYAAFYHLWLHATLEGEVYPMALPEDLNTAQAEAQNTQFDYVDPRNATVQLEMEQAATHFLKQKGALLTEEPAPTNLTDEEFGLEASVIIPVKNRRETIEQALKSAMAQRTGKPYNIIVVDNHSDDGTSGIIRRMAAEDPRIVHIIPQDNDLQIGGCWNLAANHPSCGKFCIQLDSDDVYADENTIQTIVDKFYTDRCAMVVGSYTLTDFDLNVIAPGLIDHREWTPANGRNNLLRVNGIGAPRAFYTPLLRKHPAPNVSYGEDYALALVFSRLYRVGRIYHSLYNCRRWHNNSDAQPGTEKQLQQNFYKDSLRTAELEARVQINFDAQLAHWPEAAQRYLDLKVQLHKSIVLGGRTLRVMCNPARSRSVNAHPANLIATGGDTCPCPLCRHNRPEQQIAAGNRRNGFSLLINPYPIFNTHYTIASDVHEPQAINHRLEEMLEYIDSNEALSALTFFYNGPGAGASIPQHLHFQATTPQELPMQCPGEEDNISLVLQHRSAELKLVSDECSSYFIVTAKKRMDVCRMLDKLMAALTPDEQRMNNLIIRKLGNHWHVNVYIRKAHRPEVFYNEGYERIIIGPAAAEMEGVIVTIRPEDFHRITPALWKEVMDQVSIDPKRAREVASTIQATKHPYEVEVGIAEVEEADISRLNDHTFEVKNVCIGKDFHWQQKQTQQFAGRWRIVGTHPEPYRAPRQMVVNILPIEEYLKSVIASEMNANAPMELLKAHAIISRTWVVNQIEQPKSGVNTNSEGLRWYDSSGHTLFDVCADDHCQRYQGLGSITNPAAIRAVEDTHAQILVDHRGQAIDARYSKCCGGVVEEFQYAWDDEPRTYSKACRDTDTPQKFMPDLRREDMVGPWVRNTAHAWCKVTDPQLLATVLKDYDRATTNFYRWRVSYDALELGKIIARKTGVELGWLIAITPLERGRSGRISKLRIEGTRATIVVGKELEIRRVLSPTHLYSSAFSIEVDRDGQDQPRNFHFTGAGWGHGVGLCQIGAANMAAHGYTHQQILQQYYPQTRIDKHYE